MFEHDIINIYSDNTIGTCSLPQKAIGDFAKLIASWYLVPTKYDMSDQEFEDILKWNIDLNRS
jgi:hypothetical protein